MENIFFSVSGCDLSSPLPALLNDDPSGPFGSLVLVDAEQLTLSLEKLDGHVVCVIFLLVFFFCFKRIRAAVKGMTGRGLE